MSNTTPAIEAQEAVITKIRKCVEHTEDSPRRHKAWSKRLVREQAKLARLQKAEKR